MVGTRVGPRITPEDKIERDQKICKLREQGVKARYIAERFGISVPTVLMVIKNGKEGDE